MADGNLTGLASGFAGRTFATMKLASKAGFRMLGKTLRPDAEAAEVDEATAIRDALKLFEQLDGMKGLMMKLGQMASYLDGAVPPAAQQVLAKLQAESTPMAPELIRQVMRDELGGEPEALFESFEPRPFAAASIGQVHRAVFRGRAVAVKVQYPGIERALISDVRTLGTLSRFSTAILPTNGKALVDELRERMTEECDYTAEARNQTLFARLLTGDGTSVPGVVPERSARRVLTTEMAPGAPFAAFVASAPVEVRTLAAERIFSACFTCFYHHCVFNADPHPGNYLFGDDGHVVFLDFGCVRRFEPEFIDHVKLVALSVLNGDRAGFEHAFPGTGLVGRARGFDYDAQWAAMNYLYRPFLAKGPFVYTHDYVRESYDVLVWKNPNKLKTAMPPEWLFLNRLQWGLNSVLALIGAPGNWGELFRAAVESPTEFAREDTP